MIGRHLHSPSDVSSVSFRCNNDSAAVFLISTASFIHMSQCIMLLLSWQLLICYWLLLVQPQYLTSWPIYRAQRGQLPSNCDHFLQSKYYVWQRGRQYQLCRCSNYETACFMSFPVWQPQINLTLCWFFGTLFEKLPSSFWSSGYSFLIIFELLKWPVLA